MNFVFKQNVQPKTEKLYHCSRHCAEKMHRKSRHPLKSTFVGHSLLPNQLLVKEIAIKIFEKFSVLKIIIS